MNSPDSSHHCVKGPLSIGKNSVCIVDFPGTINADHQTDLMLRQVTNDIIGKQLPLVVILKVSFFPTNRALLYWMTLCTRGNCSSGSRHRS